MRLSSAVLYQQKYCKCQRFRAAETEFLLNPITRKILPQKTHHHNAEENLQGVTKKMKFIPRKTVICTINQ